MPTEAHSPVNAARGVIDSAVEALVPVSFSKLGFGLRSRLWHWPRVGAALAGRTVVVTGATSGLGRELARTLLVLGAEVDIVGRDRARTEAAAAELATATGTAGPAVRLADMGDLTQVRELADELAAAHPRIDALVHNAGAIQPERRFNDDGIELTWASMVVGPHLLTRRLAPSLGRARVVFVTSGGMYTQALPPASATVRGAATAGASAPFNGTIAYAWAKRAQVDLVAEYQRRQLPAAAAAVVAVHPGWADTPGVADSLPGFHRLTGPVLRSAEQGIDSVLWAIDPVTVLDGGRLYFDRRPRSVARLPRTGSSPERRRELWDLVEAQSGLVDA